MAAAPDTDTVHATAVAVAGRAALFLGPPGSGKSDLALRCLMHPCSELAPDVAKLVADDRVVLGQENGALIASPPANLAGLLEIRGLGIFQLPHTSGIPVALCVKLTDKKNIDRLPRDAETTDLNGYTIECISVDPFETSAASKVMLKLAGVAERQA